MAEEAQGVRAARDALAKVPTIFVTDATDESVRIAERLRRAGYEVVEVPLMLLVTRVQAQRPNVILLDVDAEQALSEVARLRKLPGAAGIDFVYFASGAGVVRTLEDAIANEGSAFFQRPIDVDALARRIESLTGGARPEGDSPSSASLPAPGLRTAGPPLPMSVPSLADLVEPPRSFATYGTVSSELQQLLLEAEQRVEVLVHPDAPVPSPEEEIEAVLPVEVLASLDEPLDGDEDEDSDRVGTGAGLDRDGQKNTTGGGKYTTASGRTPHTHERRVEWTDNRRPEAGPPVRRSEVPRSTASPERAVPSDKPTRYDLAQPPESPAERAAPPRQPPPERESVESITIALKGDLALPPLRDLPLKDSASPSNDAPRSRPPPGAAGIVIQRPADARRFLAQAIARRSSGALCFEHDHVVRRLVVREGDLVTAASGAEHESLVCFLGARGELPRDEVERLANKTPPYGRHAGAALVAHGWLGQDQLWLMLRAHAEWIATTVLRLSGGTAQLETEPPGRLRSEPSAFGGSTGAEIFVELVRRAVSPEEAVVELGGEAARIADGPAASLLSECALPPADHELVVRAKGGTVGELVARTPDGEIAAVVHALTLLGVLDVIPAPVGRPRASDVALDDGAALDDEAIRARVRARLELVDEGDYFSLLGVARDATGYEVRRAFIELRRAFEPAKILTPRLVDLSDDVRKIVVVLEEAYEILRDTPRRERYRRAIEARPS